MLLSYLKSAYRNLKKTKVYSLINILGLTLGMTICLLLLFYVNYEKSYDTFHKNADRIYRVTWEWLNNDGASSLHLARVAPPIGPLLKNDFPGIIAESVRIRSDYQTFLQYGDKTFIEDDFF